MERLYFKEIFRNGNNRTRKSESEWEKKATLY